MRPPDFEFGSSQVDITPVTPIALAGFSYRNNHPFSGIASRIYLKAFLFRIAGRTKCILIADILWWPPELVCSIRADALERWGLDAADILLHATHTHSAPQTSSQFTSGLGKLDVEWQSFFLERVQSAIGKARFGLQPARFGRYRGQSSIAINRRVRKGIDHPSDAWPEGEIDHEVTTIVVEGMSGEPLSALVHFSCHPTILRGAEVSAEFPGVVCDAVTQSLGGSCIVGFLQGCCGDIGPKAEDDTFAEVKRLGSKLAEDTLTSLQGRVEAIIPDSSPGKITVTHLPYDHLPSLDDLTHLASQNDYAGEWARLMLERQPLASSAELETQHLPLGTGFSLVAFNAEMVSHYGLLVKSLSNGAALPCGYSNGMTGYMVTDVQHENGGYEVDESTKYFGLPSRFAHGNEGLIEQAIRRAIGPTP